MEYASCANRWFCLDRHGRIVLDFDKQANVAPADGVWLFRTNACDQSYDLPDRLAAYYAGSIPADPACMAAKSGRCRAVAHANRNTPLVARFAGGLRDCQRFYFQHAGI